MVTPLYASTTLWFFGVTKEEWLILSEKRTPIQTFDAMQGDVQEIQGSENREGGSCIYTCLQSVNGG
jgi:hypothetical protein